MTAQKRPVSISLAEDQIERLSELSRRTRIPRSVLVREGVEVVLERYETQLPLPLAAGRRVSSKKSNS
jgi:predicted DNA-binding protein